MRCMFFTTSVLPYPALSSNCRTQGNATLAAPSPLLPSSLTELARALVAAGRDSTARARAVAAAAGSGAGLAGAAAQLAAAEGAVAAAQREVVAVGTALLQDVGAQPGEGCMRVREGGYGLACECTGQA